MTPAQSQYNTRPPKYRPCPTVLLPLLTHIAAPAHALSHYVLAVYPILFSVDQLAGKWGMKNILTEISKPNESMTAQASEYWVVIDTDTVILIKEISRVFL